MPVSSPLLTRLSVLGRPPAPGSVAVADITRHFPRAVRELYRLLRPIFEAVQVAPEDAAGTSVHAVCRAVPDGLHGAYLERCAPAAPAAAALDDQLAREITARSDTLVAPWAAEL